RRPEVTLVAHDPAPEALLEEVTLARPAAVEPLRVQAGEPVHPCRQVLTRRLDQKVEMRTHQAPGMDLPPEHLRDTTLEKPEPVAVEVVEKTIGTADTAGRDVEDAIFREVRSGNARHGFDGSRARTPPTGRPREKSHSCYRDCPRAASVRVRRCFRSSGRRRSSVSG